MPRSLPAAVPVDGVAIPAQVVDFPWLFLVLLTLAVVAYGAVRFRYHRSTIRSGAKGFKETWERAGIEMSVALAVLVACWVSTGMMFSVKADGEQRAALVQRIESAYGVTPVRGSQLPTSNSAWSAHSRQVDIIDAGELVQCTAVVSDESRLYLSCPEPTDG